MKRFLLAAILLSVALRPVRAQERYDSRWIPISASEIQRQVRLNSDDPVKLYQLWWRSIYQRQKAPYFKALYDLKQRQRNNAVVISTYCSVLLESRENFGLPPSKLGQKDYDLDNIRAMLQRAKELSPRLWSVYNAEASLALFEADSDKKRFKAAQKAYKLAPLVSFTNQTLGYAYVNLSGDNRDGQYMNEAIFYYKRAQNLSPTNVGVRFLLLNVHRYYKPNPVEAKKAEKAILATIPPSVVLKPHLVQLLMRYKIAYNKRI